jgi:hypothetical protein
MTDRCDSGQTVPMRKGPWLVVALVAMLFPGGCFDPLFEDTGGAVRHFVCCNARQIDTCPCVSGGTCTSGLRACADGQCTDAPSGQTAPPCSSISADASFPGPDAGASPDASNPGPDAGASPDAGLPADASQAADAGVPTDASPPSDGSIGPSDAAPPGPDAGPDASQADAAVVITYYPCCNANTRVATCQCNGESCPPDPFTPCANGTCIPGTTSGVCP